MSTTLLAAWSGARQRLEAAGIEGPVIDARLLVEAAAGASRADIVTDPYRLLSPGQQSVLDAYVERRLRREPVSQILGRKGFWTIELGVTADVLTPRPETERLVEFALASFDAGRPFDLVDLGVGSGAVLLAVLAERPLARGVGVDASPEALMVASRNAAEWGLSGRAQLRRADWTEGLADASFDLALANPPYIAAGQIESLAPEVRDYEPRMALDGGVDGLDAHRALAPQVLRVLRPGGLFAIEISPEQAGAVDGLYRQAGAGTLRTMTDLAGRARVVTGAKKDLG